MSYTVCSISELMYFFQFSFLLIQEHELWGLYAIIDRFARSTRMNVLNTQKAKERNLTKQITVNARVQS